MIVATSGRGVRGCWSLDDPFAETSWCLGTLRASRMLVANGEMRFPIAGLVSHASPLGGLPIEGLAFADVGRFWMPDRLGGAPSVLRSVGTGVRINAAGMIFELDAVHRFDAARGWTFSFNLRPGF